MEYAVSAMWMGLESLGLYYSCKTFLPQKRSSRKVILLFVFSVALNFLIRTYNIYPFNLSQYIRILGSVAIFMLFTTAVFKGSWLNHLIIVIVFYFALNIFDTLVIYGTATVLQISVSDLVWKKLLYTVIVTIGKCVFLLLTWVLFNLKRGKETIRLSRKRLLLITLFPLVSVITLFTIFDSYKTQNDLSKSAVAFSIILGLSNVAVIYLVNSLERTYRAEQEVAILNQSMELQTENIVALEKSYRAQRSATHEFKHQLQVIYDLCNKGDIVSVQNYIRQLQSTHTARVFAVNTNHPIVDAILNEKYHVAKDADIDIHYRVNDLSALSISTDSLVVLLSNLLDNAIEGCLRLSDNRMIECTLLLGEAFFLSIRNTSPPVTIVNGEIETTKANKSEHGFGLAIVRRVLKQLSGEYAIDYSEGWFQFVVEIPR